MFSARAFRVVSQCAVMLAVGCAKTPATPGTFATLGTGGTGDVTVGCPPGSVGCAPAGTVGAPGTAGGAPVGAAGRSLVGAGGSSVVGPAAGNAGATAAAVGGGVPCDVADVVSRRCTGCHQSPPLMGSPMPLLQLSDFQAAAKSDASKKVFQVIPGRLNPSMPAMRMPPPSSEDWTDAEKQALNAWVTAGAVGSANACAIKPMALPVKGSCTNPDPPGSGGAHINCIEYNDPDMTCYKFQTHAAGDKTMPYNQGFGEQYVNFDFAAPWQGTVYERATKLANDPNSQVIHHWLFFKQSTPVTDGSVSAGSGTHPDGLLVHAWGPGASPLYFDPDVGVALESTVGYRLEAHFNNSSGGTGNDQSGAEVCVTTKAPAHLAELVWVGTDSIAGLSATGLCSPYGPFPIHIIAAQPHMHRSGVHMKVTVDRQSGTQDVVHDKDFSFDTQTYYVENFVLNQGDTMTTVCSYGQPATFGQSTGNEMCYFFSLAWPAGALRSANILATGIHGANSCM
jgi:copper type II ascorbate-dependent monooxygenase-like protein